MSLLSGWGFVSVRAVGCFTKARNYRQISTEIFIFDPGGTPSPSDLRMPAAFRPGGSPVFIVRHSGLIICKVGTQVSRSRPGPCDRFLAGQMGETQWAHIILPNDAHTVRTWCCGKAVDHMRASNSQSRRTTHLRKDVRNDSSPGCCSKDHLSVTGSLSHDGQH